MGESCQWPCQPWIIHHAPRCRCITHRRHRSPTREATTFQLFIQLGRRQHTRFVQTTSPWKNNGVVGKLLGRTCKWCWDWKGLWKKHQEVYERFINRLLLVSSSNWYLHLFITYLHIPYFHYTPSTTSPLFLFISGTGRWLLLSRLHALYVGPSIDLPPPWHWPRGGRRSPRRPGGHPGDISKSLGVENIEGWFFKVPFLNPIWK